MAVIVREKKKGSGEWWVFINYKGKRRTKKIGSKKAANLVKREVEARLARGDMGMLREKCPTVAQYGEEWLDSPLMEWAESTRINNRCTFGLHIKPQLGSKRLNEIKRKDIKTLIAKVKAKGLSPARLQSVVTVLSGMFENAIEDELVHSNPCHNTRKHCGNEAVNDIDPLTAAEVQTMLDNASKLPAVAYTFYLMAVRTGMRVGELSALEWSDIDFDNRYVEVGKSYNYHTRQVGLTKNKKSRKVDLSPVVIEALKSLLAHRKVVSIGGDDLIFVNEKGKRLCYWYLRRTINTVTPKRIRLHDLRHTYATLRIAKGDNILDVSKQLGHHKAAFTLDQYGHWMPGEHKSQVDELDNLHLTAPYAHP
jgi:integrase